MYHEPIAGQLSFAAINYNQLIELINIPCFFPPKSRSDKLRTLAEEAFRPQTDRQRSRFLSKNTSARSAIW
jgi:hypothetical protein